MQHIYNSLTPDFYNSKKEVMEYNARLAEHYGNIFNRFKTILIEIVSVNNL